MASEYKLPYTAKEINEKLDKIDIHSEKLSELEEEIDNIPTDTYTHPTESGYKHIPSGGESGQVLTWSEDGTAEWGEVSGGVGKNVTGTEYTIDGKTVIAGHGAEIFNNYTYNKASGNLSHAEGSQTIAMGGFSHAEGQGTIAGGINSHAEGIMTIASGGNSHIEGASSHQYTEAWNKDISNTKVMQLWRSGSFGLAKGNASHCEGKDCLALGDNSHAEGNKTIASGNYSHTEGIYTKASSEAQHAQGKYNIEDTENKYAHIVGNGTANDALSNAHTLDWDGNAWFAGKVYIGGTSQDDATELGAGGVGKNVTGTSYTINGSTVTAGDGAEVFNDYRNNKASGEKSHAEGYGTTASGNYGSHAEGYQTTASGAFASHAEGSATKASGETSHAEGRETIASGNYGSHAEGYETKATGHHASHAEGEKTTASGAYGSHAEGYETKASGKYGSHAEGSNTKASSEAQHAQGKYNIEDSSSKYAHIVGNGTADDARSNAHTLDWDGNAWFAGKVYVGGTSQDDATELGTHGGDLSDFATIVDKNIIKYAHTPNISDDGTQNGNYSNNYKDTQVVTIPGATQLNVTLKYGTESVSYDYVCVYAGNHPEYTTSSTGYLKKLGGTYSEVNFTVEGDSVTFAFKSDGSNVGYGYYAIIEGAQPTNYFDFDGNVLITGDVYIGGVTQDDAVKLGDVATTSTNGLMSAEDKTVLDMIKEWYISTCGTPGLAYTLKDDGTYECTGIGTTTDTHIYIPLEYEGLPITSIGYKAFYQNRSVKSIDIKNNMINIGDNAFHSSSIESLYVDSIETLCNLSFDGGYTSLPKKLYINKKLITGDIIIDNVTKIKSAIFKGNQNITNVTLSDSITSIPLYLFRGCTLLTNATLSNNIKFLPERTFSNCTSLTNLTIPDSVTSGGYYICEGCTSLVSVTIGKNLSGMNPGAFHQCTSLENISVSSENQAYKVIDNVLFTCDTTTGNLKSLYTYPGGKKDSTYEIPAGVTFITQDAASHNQYLKHLIISDGVKIIYCYAFRHCQSLESIVIPASITKIDYSVFQDCTSLKNVYYKGTEEQWAAITINSTGNSTFLNATITYNYTGS